MAAATTRPYIVGLTGGIGSGKTTATNMFADLGAEVIDADDISRALLSPGSDLLPRVREHFGDAVFDNGALNRAKLRELVFADAQALAWLEDLLHPRIREEILRRIDDSSSSWVLLSVPLLLESDAYDFVDCVIVVDIPEQLQLSRTAARDDSDEETIRRIMSRQMPREERLRRADMILYNDAGLGHLQRQVSALYHQLEEASHDRDPPG